MLFIIFAAKNRISCEYAQIQFYSRYTSRFSKRPVVSYCPYFFKDHPFRLSPEEKDEHLVPLIFSSLFSLPRLFSRQNTEQILLQGD